MDQAVDLIEARARHDSPERAVFLRVGQSGSTTYLDLGDESGRVVEIGRLGYRVIPTAPILFRRSHGTRALPMPRSGSVYDLAPLLNISDEHFDLVVIFEVSILVPSGPFPVLDFCGEQGSAKTSATRMVSQLIDPRVPQVRGDPKQTRDLLIAAEKSWIVALDNLSSMTKGLADVICRITTGTGASTKENYSDTDEVLFTACRPVVFNGIPDLVRRPDLQDRALCVDCLPVPDDCRQTEVDIQHRFQEVHAGVLGAFCAGAVMEIRCREEVANRATRLPRLADVALRAEGASPAFGWEEGKAADLMLGNRAVVRKRSVAQNEVARHLVEHARKYWGSPLFYFYGTATDLLNELQDVLPSGLPTSPNQLSALLNELSPALREQGVVIDRGREGRGGQRWITVRYEGSC